MQRRNKNWSGERVKRNFIPNDGEMVMAVIQ